jgi:hypothetical protein
MGALSDEPPIRVRNGSMKITLGSSQWAAAGQAWVPLEGTNAGGFIVVVEFATSSGRRLGQPVFGTEVDISYSDHKVVKFKVDPSAKKTKVTPKGILQKTADRVLEHGQAGKGYITGVTVKDRGTSWTCALGSRNALSEIDIYPLPHAIGKARPQTRRTK